MEKEEKEYIKQKFATWLRKTLEDKKKIAINNKFLGIEDMNLIESMRQLEAASGLSYTIIQGSSTGKRDIQFTTLMILLDSLKISFREFAVQYEEITDKEIQKKMQEIKANKKPVVKRTKNKSAKK